MTKVWNHNITLLNVTLDLLHVLALMFYKPISWQLSLHESRWIKERTIKANMWFHLFPNISHWSFPPIVHGLLLLMTNSKTCEVPKHGLIANPLHQIQGFDDPGVSITYKMQLHPNSRCLPLAQITDLWFVAWSCCLWHSKLWRLLPLAVPRFDVCWSKVWRVYINDRLSTPRDELVAYSTWYHW